MAGMDERSGFCGRVIERVGTIFEPRRLAVAVAVTLAMLVTTHIPQQMMPPSLDVALLDKLEHVLAYGAVVFLWLLSFRRPPGLKAMAGVVLAAAALGAVDELTQPLVNRTACPVDWAADLVGAVVACGLFGLVRHCRRERLLRSALEA